jgi:hypothetical protein
MFKFMLFVFAISFSSFKAQAGLFADCAHLLTGEVTASIQVKSIQQQLAKSIDDLNRAFEEGTPASHLHFGKTAAYLVLLAIGESDPVRLTLRERAALLHFIRESQFADEIDFNSGSLAKTLNLSGDIAWSLGPFWFRPLAAKTMDNLLYRRYFNKALRKLSDPSLAAQVAGISSERIKAALPHLTNILMKIGYSRNSSYRTSPSLPAAIVAGSLLIFGAAPIQVLDSAVSAQGPLKPIKWKNYFAKIEEKLKDAFAGQRVLVIYSSQLYERVDLLPDPTPAFEEMRNLQTKVSQFTSVKVQSMAQLKQVLRDHAETDTVILMVHGLPDTFSIGGESLDQALSDRSGWPKLKKGANLIFVSCLLGQKGGERSLDENWVKLSDLVLDGGSAVAATKLITFFLPSELAKQDSSGNPLISVAVTTVFDGLGRSFVKTAVKYADVALYQLGNQYFWQPGLIRVYDHSTGTIADYKVYE